MKRFFVSVLFLMGLLMQTIYADPALLLHGDANFDDSSSYTHVITANGDAQISNAQFKFGGASILFDGSGDYLSTPDSEDWNFGSGDFTIDCWVNFSSNVVHQTIYSQSVDSAHNVIFSYHSSGFLVFVVNNGSCLANSSIPFTPTINVWYHIAVVRSGTDIKYAVNGIFFTPSVITSIGLNSLPDLSTSAMIGYDSVYSLSFNGYIDEFRIVKGTAVWTSNFTPPNIPYGTTIPTPTISNATAGDQQVSLTWSSVANATGYKIKYGTSAGSPPTVVDVGDNTTFNVTSLANGTSYYFVVTAYNSTINSESTPSTEVTSTPFGIPSAPTINTVTANSTEVVLSWGAVAGATGYTVKYGTTSGSYSNSVNVTSTSYSCTGLTNGITYYFVVSASNANGESPNSGERSSCPSTASSLWMQNGNDIYYNAGNVGINSSTPTTKLDVEGTIKANEVIVDSNSGLTVKTGDTEIGAVNFSDGSTSPGGYVEYNQADNSMAIGTNGANAIEIDSAQNVTFKGNVTVDGGTITLPPSVTSSIIPKGYIRGMTLEGSGQSLTVMPGIAECNGQFFEISSFIQHTMQNLPTQQADLPIFHYIYIDNDNISNPSQAIINSADRPKWDESRLGWYRFYQGVSGTSEVGASDKNDRCIGAVWIIWYHSRGEIIPADYTEDGRVLFTCPLIAPLRIFLGSQGAGGTQAWAPVEDPLYPNRQNCIPVNACGGLFYIENHDEGTYFNPNHLTRAELRVSNAYYKLSSYGCYATSTSGWLYWGPSFGAYPPTFQYRTCSSADEGFEVQIWGYQMQR